jgi:hypothetical protein
MGKYKELLMRVKRLEERGIADRQRIKVLECENHKWVYIESYYDPFFDRVARYRFRCENCEEEISWPAEYLSNSMRCQLECIGILKKPVKKRKKIKKTKKKVATNG